MGLLRISQLTPAQVDAVFRSRHVMTEPAQVLGGWQPLVTPAGAGKSARLGQMRHQIQAGSWRFMDQVMFGKVMRGGSGVAAPSFLFSRRSE